MEEFIINQCVIFIFKSYFSVSVLLQYILKLNLSASERFKSKIEKELSFCTNLSFQIPVTLNPVIFQTLLSWSNTIYSLKYLRSTTLFCKDIGVRKSEFATKTQFLYNKKHTTVFLEQKTCDSVLGTKKHTTVFLERKKHTTEFLEQKTYDSVLGTKNIRQGSWNEKHTTMFLERKNIRQCSWNEKTYDSVLGTKKLKVRDEQGL